MRISKNTRVVVLGTLTYHDYTAISLLAYAKELITALSYRIEASEIKKALLVQVKTVSSAVKFLEVSVSITGLDTQAVYYEQRKALKLKVSKKLQSTIFALHLMAEEDLNLAQRVDISTAITFLSMLYPLILCEANEKEIYVSSFGKMRRSQKKIILEKLIEGYIFYRRIKCKKRIAGLFSKYMKSYTPELKINAALTLLDVLKGNKSALSLNLYAGLLSEGGLGEVYEIFKLARVIPASEI